ncbi:valyl-tRNA synthetase (valine--tRNA ligase) (valrs) [Lacticaseibacillus pantheris DSM 15945 = JCM 12539 = NBRC 106106]|uniref:Valine--tRNA ligase n=1 Tax=Lacticaseibacillus pantheris DSM 15945 = JCM 12539 = NBRC 106106 TaxID=1423783 RepID=A0A0R1TT28_9LACO|nr:valine--tRNA ligase [Lacticaseibacillus pantheris]KRL84470.1 valyl-tRNA synthetase (valine--tRNA ligase) (valrs) [Lacticaseibacillus pantheris DSM 15945 = JCM 12539 = NBRC 106106]
MTEHKLAPKYDPKSVENGRYQQWVESGVFKPSGNQKAKPYTIVIPPPNVTGKLHMGHAWDTTLQDMIIRQKRMQGFDTLYLPGMDHAGIATQAKVEAKLREQGISRYDLGRDKFVEKVWEWKDEFSKIIRNQWGKMGLSLDYDRERFTLDEGLSQAVRKVFVDLYNQGLIYRGEYIVNWDPQARTALSDIEVIHQDDEGAFYHMIYKFADGTPGGIEIATTRPETMFGDTAVAVNRHDPRYEKVIGKKVIVPGVGREIPIIADEHADMNFGTGAVKITPAHDPNDFQVGLRHNLERINCMNDDGTMNDEAGKYAGMDRFDCRKALVKDLQASGDLIQIEPIVHSVGHSERTGVQVEARLSTQWFVKMKPLAEKLLDNQKTDNKVDFVPGRFEHTLTNWMENIHDWVISRQLWWGHRIPAWFNKETGAMYVGMEAPEDAENWEQDPDVLDTWFSSALWPFSTLGWPDTDAADYKRYYPTNTLVTGYDIIPFWVARMMFQGLHFTDQRPFEHVLIHGLMRDEQGRKMSKSLGNGIDPIDVIDKYGTDALRWFLANGTTPGQDARFSYTQLDSAWNFINKIWNVSRYIMMNLDADQAPAHKPDPAKFDLADKWIFAELNRTVASVTAKFDKFEFGEAGRDLYNFIWGEFADWYIEISKATLTGDDEVAKAEKRNNLLYVLDQILRLLHPIMPFVTEKLWLNMPHEGDSIVTAAYPVTHAEFDNDEAAAEMTNVLDLIRAVRKIRNDVNAPLSTPIDVIISLNDNQLENAFTSNREVLDRFLHTKTLEILADGVEVKEAQKSASAVMAGATVYVPLAELVDFDKETARLNKTLAKLDGEITRIDKKLGNPGFTKNAPAEVIEEQKQKRAGFVAEQAAAQERLAQLDAAQN